MEKLVVGLIKGRHEMPVSEYILEEVPDVFDLSGISERILSFLENRVGISPRGGYPLNGNDYADIDCFRGDRDLVVYVTGLTCVTAELIKLCAMNGISLTLMHFNNATGEYIPQEIFR